MTRTFISSRRFGLRGLTFVGALALPIVLDDSAGAQDAPAAPPSAPAVTTLPATRLKGAAAWKALVGMTVVAQARTGGYTEYYAPDGGVIHLDKDGKAKGKWSVEGEKVCFDFAEEDDRSCVDVEVEGRKGSFVDEDASRDTFEVLDGNAKSL